MLIVLEGPDGSGKTTLATRIRKDLDQYCLFLRSNGPPSTLLEFLDIVHFLQEIEPRLPVVTDRNPLISEYVYGLILRGKRIHGLSVEQMATWLKSNTTLLIYCRPKFAELDQGVRREQQLEGVIENHRLLPPLPTDKPFFRFHWTVPF